MIARQAFYCLNFLTYTLATTPSVFFNRLSLDLKRLFATPKCQLEAVGILLISHEQKRYVSSKVKKDMETW